LVKAEYVEGQVFYAYTTGIFYILVIDPSNGTRNLETTTDYLAKNGRQSLYFQYRHNAPLSTRIDPGTANIIDVYVVTNEYYTVLSKLHSEM
jgi:hypothetical protein